MYFTKKKYMLFCIIEYENQKIYIVVVFLLFFNS